MKYYLPFILLFLLIPGMACMADEPDSAYLFAYTSGKHRHTAGLHYAWSVDGHNWHAIGPEFRFLGSDFGAWGSQKKMISPFVFQDKQGMWHCLWTLNREVGQFAHAASEDLYTWKRQSYPAVMENGNVLDLEVSFDAGIGSYILTWLSETEGQGKVFQTTTSDFKHYAGTTGAGPSVRRNARKSFLLEGEQQEGVTVKVPWEQVDALIKRCQWSKYHEQERADNMSKDPLRFKDLHSLHASVTLEPEKSKAISDMLIGVFFEDINYAADGGLYAELVQNRGFEYALSDKKGRDQSWNARKAWSLSGDGITFAIDTLAPLHRNNRHYALLEIASPGAALVNEGFNGIPVTQGEAYYFSVFAKSLRGDGGHLLIRLRDEAGDIIAEGQTGEISGSWEAYEEQLTAGKSADNARLEIVPQFPGQLALDMISLSSLSTVPRISAF